MHQEAADAVTALWDLFMAEKHLGNQTLFHLQTALSAAGVAGIGGHLVVKLPEKANQRLDCVYIPGQIEMTARWPQPI